MQLGHRQARRTSGLGSAARSQCRHLLGNIPDRCIKLRQYPLSCGCRGETVSIVVLPPSPVWAGPPSASFYPRHAAGELALPHQICGYKCHFWPMDRDLPAGCSDQINQEWHAKKIAPLEARSNETPCAVS